MTGTAPSPRVDDPQDGGVSHEVFRRVMASFVTGVTVITTQVRGELRGMTANSFTSAAWLRSSICRSRRQARSWISGDRLGRFVIYRFLRADLRYSPLQRPGLALSLAGRREDLSSDIRHCSSLVRLQGVFRNRS